MMIMRFSSLILLLKSINYIEYISHSSFNLVEPKLALFSKETTTKTELQISFKWIELPKYLYLIAKL